jgi:hypothetical protein
VALGLDGSLSGVSYVGVSPGAGYPLQVTIAYNAASETLTVQLYNSTYNYSGIKTYTQVDLAQLLGGESGWIGFTGATGGISSTQTVSNFQLALGAAVVNSIPEITEIGTPGSDAWVPVQSQTGYLPTVSNNVLTLTGTGYENGSSAAWFGQPVSTMAPFEVNFTYAGQTDIYANDYPDGCAFVLQNSPQATNAIGYNNIGAWQVGADIPNSFAVLLVVNTTNLAGGPYTNGAIAVAHSGSLLSLPVSTGQVELGSHPIAVNLQYNPATQTLSYTLTDTVNGNQSTGSFTGIDVPSLVQSETAILGFTGSNTNTATTANQTIADFSFVSNVIQAGSLNITAGGNVGQSAAVPLPLNVSGTVNLYGNEIWISQAAGTLTLGQVEAEDDVTITTGGDLAAATQIAQGSIGGFSGSGSGWTVNGSANLGAAVNPPDTVLQLVNGSAANEVGAAWDPSPVLWQNGFSTGFIINPVGSATGLGLTLTLQNDPRTTAAIGGAGSTLGTDGATSIQNSVSLQFLVGAAGLKIGLGTNGAAFNIAQQTLASYNPSDPLQVVVTYNPNGTTVNGVTETLLVTLVNTNTGATYKSFFNPAVDLLAVLGKATAILGMTGASGSTAAPLAVSNFYYSYGGTNIVAANLDIQSGGSVGSSSQPLVIQIPDAGVVNVTATDNITLLALAGSLNTGTVTAGGTATLLAPDGSVTASSGTPQVAAMSFGPMLFAAAAPSHLITAAKLVVDARDSVGALDNPLITQIGELQARGTTGDVALSNTGALHITASPRLPGVVAGGQVQLNTTGSLLVDAAVKAGEALHLEVLDQGLAQQTLTATSNARIESLTGDIQLLAPDAVRLASGSRVTTHGGGTGVQVALTRWSEGPSDALIQSQGQIVSDHVSLQGGSRGTRFEIAQSGLSGNTQRPMIDVQGTPETDRLVVDHRDAQTGGRYVVSDSESLIDIASAVYHHSSIDAVELDLGNFADTVIIRALQQIQSVVVRGNGGNDQFQVEFRPGGTSRVEIDGGTGTNGLTYDGAGGPLWAKPGVVQSLTARIEHTRVQNLVSVNTPALNGTPIYTGPNVDAQLAGLTAVQKYVQRTYLQLVQRLATPTELATWVKSINVNPNDPSRRLALVNSLLATEEAGRVQIQAWSRTFAGRAATTSELTTYLALWRTLKDPLLVQQQFLVSSAVTQYLQSLSTTGTADERYVEGLWRLMIDPGVRLTTAEKQALVVQRNKLGRVGFVASLQKQPGYLQSQKEGFSQILSGLTAAVDTVWTGAPAFTSFVDMYRWILARRKV